MFNLDVFLMWVIPGGVIHAPICRTLNNKLQRSNHRTHRGLRENPKGKTTQRERESSTII